MRTIGLLGGMSWESTADYYRIINRRVRDLCGKTASAKCLLWSFDFSEIERLQHQGDWEELTARMIDAARRIEAAGADMLLICANTMHLMADRVQAALTIPLIHISDPTAEQIRRAGLRNVGLLGTAFTMERDFYKDRLTRMHGLTVTIPDTADRAIVHRVIYDELVAGIVSSGARAEFRRIIADLVARGAEAIVLACTELVLLVQPEDSAVPVFDTTSLHAEAAVALALNEAAAN